ncbi:CPBP family intramembrane metalloprotease [Nesterenkonia sp. E16_7]|uniref:CPBP family intramembrane glutamic endopeptidase n=1 Tax=unclassified Nesterenkonia TaxID=2629769 RepID=UPI001A914E32|nr:MULTISPECIES: CPBP family intramembrane glutamic endopeptidase [unclassified Nesterenkonia]MBO0594977.1 CPBP family intramembrane metalloprotease [Nesterenkonia sp. E16_10]MBO0598632.1 CPBP family intramembrane metalloprotease [Nesterenkonia sp. E16_7]
MRVQPRAWIAVAVVAGYAAIMGLTWFFTGTDYETVGSTAANAMQGIVLPVALASLFTAAVTYWLGWWGPALRDTPAGPRWLLLLPIFLVLTAAGNLLGHGFEGIEAQLVLTLALGTLLVGFGEELTLRGVSVVALRGSFGEVGVWFFSSLLFALLHALNVFFGQSAAATLEQIVFAFVIGSALYVVRRVTGTLVICMLVHAFWDFSTFVGGASTGEATGFAALALFQYAVVVVAIIGLVLVLRQGRSSTRHSRVAAA